MSQLLTVMIVYLSAGDFALCCSIASAIVAAFLMKRKNGYRYIVYRDGDRWRWLSTGTKDEAKAREIFNSLKNTLEKDRPKTLKELRDAILDYGRVNLRPSTVELYRMAFDNLIECVGNKPVKHISAMDGERLKQHLLNK